jgi:hypothetical protein
MHPTADRRLGRVFAAAARRMRLHSRPPTAPVHSARRASHRVHLRSALCSTRDDRAIRQGRGDGHCAGGHAGGVLIARTPRVPYRMSSSTACSGGLSTRQHAAAASRPARRVAHHVGGWRHVRGAAPVLASVHHDAAHGGCEHTAVESTQHQLVPRRRLLAWSSAAAVVAVSVGSGDQAVASSGRPPAGYELYRDTLDGYSFFYPSDWLQVKARSAQLVVL